MALSIFIIIAIQTLLGFSLKHDGMCVECVLAKNTTLSVNWKFECFLSFMYRWHCLAFQGFSLKHDRVVC